MFGILVDVSGSMKSAYSLDSSSSHSNVRRTHAIFTTIVSIAKKEIVHHERRECIFAGAFGLCKASETCDLISLLDFVTEPQNQASQESDAYKALIDIAKQHEAPHAEPWIIKHLSPFEARVLYKALRCKQHLIPKLINLIPSELTINSAMKAVKAKEKVVEAKNKAVEVARDTRDQAVYLKDAAMYYKDRAVTAMQNMGNSFMARCQWLTTG